MPRLLRRAAPSPSVAVLSLSAPAPSLASSVDCSSSQRCVVHGTISGRSSLGRRRSLNSLHSSETDTSSSSEERDSREENVAATAAAAAAEVDREAAAGIAPADRSSGSLTCTCPPTARSRASQGSSKRLSTRLEDLAATAIEDAPENNDLFCDDDESVCSIDHEFATARDSISSTTSSRVVIRDTQLAALDVEIQNLRKTFVKSIYARLTSMSRKLSKRSSTQRIAST